MVEMESISQTGQSTMKMEYKDIVLNPELLDELFLLPVGLDIHKPRSITEYSEILIAIFNSGSAIPQPALSKVPEPAPQLPIRPRLGPVKIDISTGRAMAPVPPEMSQLEFDLLSTPPKPPIKLTPARSWRMLFLMVLPLLLLLTFFGVCRWKASRASL